jgi:hypothetical protein
LHNLMDYRGGLIVPVDLRVPPGVGAVAESKA